MLGKTTGNEIDFVVVPQEQIDSSLINYYGKEEVIQKAPKHGASADGENSGDEAPIITMVNQIITEAYRLRTSDIHLEPLENVFVSVTVSTASCKR